MEMKMVMLVLIMESNLLALQRFFFLRLEVEFLFVRFLEMNQQDKLWKYHRIKYQIKEEDTLFIYHSSEIC